jgi:hypothetical protein
MVNTASPDRDKYLKDIVSDIIDGNRPLNTKAHFINVIYKNQDEEKTWCVEFLSFTEADGERIFGRELFDTARSMGPDVVKSLDFIALEEARKCVENNTDGFGNNFGSIRCFHFNLSNEILYDDNLITSIKEILDTCYKKGGARVTGVFELPEDLNGFLVLKRLKNIIKILKDQHEHKVWFALDDTFYIVEDEIMFRMPLTFHLELFDNIKFFKVDYRFFQEIIKKDLGLFKYPETLKRIIQLDDKFDYNERNAVGMVIFEGIEFEAYKNDLRDFMGRKSKPLIQGNEVDLRP